MRDLHERMLSAVLDGAGLEGLAELATREIGGPVAILLPRSGLEAGLPREDPPGAGGSGHLRTWAEAAGEGNGKAPATVQAWVPVIAGGEEIGRERRIAELCKRPRTPARALPPVGCPDEAGSVVAKDAGSAA